MSSLAIILEKNLLSHIAETRIQTFGGDKVFIERVVSNMMYNSGPQPFETLGPLTNFVSRQQTTTENCVMEKMAKNWSVYVCISLQNEKVALVRRPPGRC